ncbi:MAG TPA: ABC transporter substrate-binding protein [Bryobacteraceae bacterium]|nr:ABC transporter substrate-binding protein [Bryobacteraceae bacterium]
MDLSTTWSTLDPGDGLPDTISPLIAETLVRLNAKGEAEPWLAVNWQRDADRKRWRFSLRPRVVFHDGEPLTAASAAASLGAALKKRYGEVTVTAGGQTLVVQSNGSMPDLLTELANPRMAIFRKSDKVALIGTGPFRVGGWEPGRRLTLAAFDDYWGGRPFVDAVNMSLGATRANGDVFDLPVGPGRRIVPERTRIWSSEPRELIAVLTPNMNPAVQQALALSLDRGPIVTVLAQRKGEAAYGLLPQWLSGYSFLFVASPDVARAKAIVGQMRITPLTLSYPANDAFLRSVADRVALNARDAGIVIQPVSNANGNLRLVRLPLESTDAVAELVRIAALLGTPERVAALNASKPETLYEAERALIEERRIIPLMYLPDVYGVGPRVHNWEGAHRNGSFRLHLESVWVE